VSESVPFGPRRQTAFVVSSSADPAGAAIPRVTSSSRCGAALPFANRCALTHAFGRALIDVRRTTGGLRVVRQCIGLKDDFYYRCVWVGVVCGVCVCV
jgi:hypothetical protein